MVKQFMCYIGLHSFVVEDLQYSTLRRCKKCGLLQFMNVHPAAEKRWVDCTPEYEKHLRNWKPLKAAQTEQHITFAKVVRAVPGPQPKCAKH